MFKYKNVSENELMIPGVGLVEAGGEISSAEELSNANLQPMGTEEPTVAPAPAAPAATPVAPVPAPVAPAAPVASVPVTPTPTQEGAK